MASDLGAVGSAAGEKKKPRKKNATQLAVEAINKAFAEAGDDVFGATPVAGSINMLQHAGGSERPGRVLPHGVDQTMAQFLLPP